jgi:hypothetical protein
MATYASLSQSEKDTLAAWERNFRGWANGIMATGIIQARALDASHGASGGAGDILATLDANEVVPNSSGIAGALDLDTVEWTTLVNAFDTFLTTYDTVNVRQHLAKAAGPTAGL